MSFEVFAKIQRLAQVLRRCLKSFNVGIVGDLEFVVVDKRLVKRRKVQEQCPQQNYQKWNEAAGLLHGRYYVKDRRHTWEEWVWRFNRATGILLTTMMEIVSVNVGTPTVMKRDSNEIATGIFKSAVQGPVTVRRLNLDGDAQADLRVHGGVYKAVYAYPVEHYPFWGSVYPELELRWGMFGENLTTAGVNESFMCIGDQVRIGTVILQVTQPRVPCFKLAAKFDDDEIIDTFFASGRSGMYFCVVQEGQLQAGDKMELVHRDPAGFSIWEALKLYAKEPGRETIERALRTETLPPGLRKRVENFRDAP